MEMRWVHLKMQQQSSFMMSHVFSEQEGDQYWALSVLTPTGPRIKKKQTGVSLTPVQSQVSNICSFKCRYNEAEHCSH